MSKKLAILALTACAAAATTHVSAAETFPTKPIRIIVGVAGGGSIDMMARLIAKGLTEEFKQSVIVENRPGASALIGARYVAHSDPDGYTLLAVANTFVSAPEFLTDANYDPMKDFVPITQISQTPMVLLTNPSVPQTNVRDLIARAKAQPGAVSFASSGVGSTGDIATKLFSRQAGITLLSVAYKGNAQALTDLVSGQVMGMFDQVSASTAFVKSGKLHALAVTTKNRSVLLPDVPTLAESGLTGYDDSTFNAIVAPAGTPAAVVAKLHDGIVKVLSPPALQKQLAAQGIEVKTSATPQILKDDFLVSIKKYRSIAAAGTAPK
jgi:tripartite-type tricarboxylate transporter receptor subunit TctC